MSSEFVSEVEGVLGEHEAELELNQQRSPRPGEEGPCFPARALLDIMNAGIQVYARECCKRPSVCLSVCLPLHLSVYLSLFVNTPLAGT